MAHKWLRAIHLKPHLGSLHIRFYKVKHSVMPTLSQLNLTVQLKQEL